MINQEQNNFNILQDLTNTFTSQYSGTIKETRVLREPEEINSLFSQIPQNPYECITELCKISDAQKFPVSNESLNILMITFTNAIPELKIIIIRLLDNLLSNNDNSVVEFLSNPAFLSLFWNAFPEKNVTKILTKLVDKNPSIINLLAKQVDEQQLLNLMSEDNPNLESIMIFFSHVFSKSNVYLPIIEKFLLHAIKCAQLTDDDDLRYEALNAITKMCESFVEASNFTIASLPQLCVYNEEFIDNNFSVLELIISIVKKLQTYQMLLNDKILYFLTLCFNVPADTNDDSNLFFVLKLLTAVEDISPLGGNLPLIERLSIVIEKVNAKYDINENAVIALCRFIKYGIKQQVEDYLKIVNFSTIFEFADHDNELIQKSILEAIINIQNVSEQNGNDFITTFFVEEEKIQTLDNLSQSPNESIAHCANLIIEKISA
ncbi:hypothetical protein TRFO_20037 [Tritrichomonas foetus]|uniref:Uncharacterized protein n=1 Tax=Tritrichomonas foetus TaxID=1144522 RepID=A0A1J4KHN3_9EUKA|nr:hypothetical protein TRFO_20037 [Tritrichomonas foetus]|eukprot:OHT10554.1 hypothetical protein TRFO_20037 [Tritrichomonas foetus]